MIDNDKRIDLVTALYNKDEKKTIAILDRLSKATEESGLKSLLLSNKVLDDATKILSTEDQKIFARFQQDIKLNHFKNIIEISGLARDRVVFDSMLEEMKRQRRLTGEMFINTGHPILDAILRAASRKLAEDITTTGFESLLGLFIHGGLTIIFPPLAPLYLSWSRLITWFTMVGIDAQRDLRQGAVANTVYKISTEKPDVINVRNLDPKSLTRFPGKLPEQYEILVKELFYT